MCRIIEELNKINTGRYFNHMPILVQTLKRLLMLFCSLPKHMSDEEKESIRKAFSSRLLFSYLPLDGKVVEQFSRTLESISRLAKSGPDTHIKHRKDTLGRYVIHIIAEYVSLWSGSSYCIISGEIKDKLFPGICALMDLCDRYQYDMLIANLDRKGKAAFQTVNEQYTERHKFKGKV